MRCATRSARTYTYVMFARLAIALRGTEGDLNRTAGYFGEAPLLRARLGVAPRLRPPGRAVATGLG